MSWILETLGCLLCWEEDNNDENYDDYYSLQPTNFLPQIRYLWSNWTSRRENHQPVESDYRNVLGSSNDSVSTGYSRIDYSERSTPLRPSATSTTPSRPPSLSSASSSVWKPTTISSAEPSSSLFSPPPSASPFLVPLPKPSSSSSSAAAPPTWISKPTLTVSKPPTSSAKPSSSPLPALVLPPSPSVSKTTISVAKPSNPSPRTPSTPNTSLSYKVKLSPARSRFNDKEDKTKYVLQGTDPLPTYAIPEDIKALIEKDTVPGVLYKPLQSSTYKDYFAALLYAEDYYIEKWSGFELENVVVELQAASIYRKSRNKQQQLWDNDEDEENKLFAAFKFNCIPERRPFILSRDFVFAKPTGRNVDPFQGVIYKVAKGSTVLVEFDEDFYLHHRPNHRYDISFSFNRVCLKRAHQAVSAASDPLFHDYIFPDRASRQKNTTVSASPLQNRRFKLDSRQNSAINRILSFQGPPPYLIEGPNISKSSEFSETSKVVQTAVLKIYNSSPQSKVLICAPTNKACDILLRSLKKEIPESHMFRANAAFRELDEVPDDVLPSCRYKGECFSCPPLQELRAFRVIFSTFVSSFRLHTVGISAGHFSHIFLVDASLAIEPETMIPLSNMAGEETAVIVTGSLEDNVGRVRSYIARSNGLRVSYFERLRKSSRYSSFDPVFITKLVD